MEQLEKLNVEKRKNKISIKLATDTKTINNFSQTLRKQIEEYEQPTQNKKPTKTLTITSNLALNEILNLYLKNKFIMSIFGYSNKSNFVKTAFLNQVKSDLKELQQEQ
ncbi:hypothetical protein KVM86_07480 [Helicobacter pylori]|nr:hypothetical protein KVM86_07480 [Helicobacter pylori]